MNMSPKGRVRLSSSVFAFFAVVASTAAMPALAQEAPAAESENVSDEEAGDPQSIVVTGSRIARPELNSAAPVTAITSDQLTLSGNTGAGDIIQYIPALFSSVTSDLSATRAGIFGGTQLNLRDLGAARTLVLVNGRRHVAGSAGTAIVDVETIPTALIDRVDVLTGGASSVYGSDAVSGVVNYVLKRDLEGFVFDGQAGISERGDAGDYFISGAYGKKFADDRGNITVALSYSRGEALSYGDRDYLRGGQRLDDDANPALRFQAGDITPALAAAGAVPGQTILRSGAPRFPGATPQALIDRATNAAPRVFLPSRNFSISSARGLIGFDADGDLVADDPGTDFDANGVNDCDQTYNFAITGFGCYVTENGRVRPFRDGLIAGFANSFGGDGINVFLDQENLVPQVEQFNANLNLRYDFSPAFKPFIESKFVQTKASDVNNVNSFNDTIPIRLDNPFIPTELSTAINAFYLANPGLDPADGQILISRDNTDFGPNRRRVTRDTYRVVVGAEGEIASNWNYEVSANYGRTKETEINDNVRLEDRFYAAVDAVRNPATGQIVCRSSLNPNAIPGTSPFPSYDADPDGDGIFEPDTFSTNDGTCRPLNLFGLGAPSAEAVAFVNPRSRSATVLEQFVAQAFIAGTTEGFFTLPGGAPGIVIGAEYREEKSRFGVDPFDQAGFFFESGTQPETGSFDVKEVFGELELPFLADLPFADLLSVKGSARYSDYNLDNVGSVFTWAVDGIYRPVADLTFRGSYSRAVRAPNITNLFSPTTPATFRPIDPCDEAQINRGPNPAVRLANCRADGIPVGFTDPLTARITGQTGGNPNLEEERSTSWTVGGVIQPSFLRGFTATVDYWNYEISNAIANVTEDEIASGCYDSPDFPNNGFCALFSRNRTAGSPTFLGFNSFSNGPVNFARFEAQGIDFQARYRFPLGGDAGAVTARIGGTYLIRNTTFTSVTNPNSEDDFRGEAQRPELAFNTGLAWEIGKLRAEWETFWQSRQFYQGIDVEDPSGFAEPNRDGNFWSHDLNFAYDVTEVLTFRFGVNNLTDERPFAAEAAYPISAIGRNYFIGFRAKY
ncbi:MAG: TonB-dependent receptor [Sphingopyxis sp.]|nr:TonB-dependent receptor [Sphingopyxis sp.]